MINLPSELEKESKDIKKDYEHGKSPAKVAAFKMHMLAHVHGLDAAKRAEFARNVYVPFLQQAYADGKMSADDAAWHMLIIPDDLGAAGKAEFALNIILPFVLQAFADGKMSAVDAAFKMCTMANFLDAASRLAFARDIFAPFQQQAVADGKMSADDAARRMLDIAYRLDAADRESFLNSQNIFTIDLKTDEWESLTSSWETNNGAKMRLFMLGDKPFAKVGRETVTMYNYKELLDKHIFEGDARTPFLRAVEAMQIEKEHRGFFVGLDKAFQGLKPALKTPEVA